jgi:hypothetical protein
LVAIGHVVSEEKIFPMGNSHKNLFLWNQLLNKLEPNFDKIVIGWSSSKIVSGGPAL